MALTLFTVAVSGQEIQSKASPDTDSKPDTLPNLERITNKTPETIHGHYIARMNDAGLNLLDIMHYNYKKSIGDTNAVEPKWMPEIEVFRDLIENAPSHDTNTEVYSSIGGMTKRMYITESGATTTQEKGQKEVYHRPILDRISEGFESVLGWVEGNRLSMNKAEGIVHNKIFPYIDDISSGAIAFNPMDDIDVMAQQAGLTGGFSQRPALFAKVAFIEAAQTWADQQGYKNIDLSGVLPDVDLAKPAEKLKPTTK